MFKNEFIDQLMLVLRTHLNGRLPSQTSESMFMKEAKNVLCDYLTHLTEVEVSYGRDSDEANGDELGGSRTSGTDDSRWCGNFGENNSVGLG